MVYYHRILAKWSVMVKRFSYNKWEKNLILHVERAQGDMRAQVNEHLLAAYLSVVIVIFEFAASFC